MELSFKTAKLFQRHIALPTDHGSWVFLISPLLIGLFAAPGWSLATVFLIVAAFAFFLIRQPMTIAVKVYSKRRARRDLAPASFWVLVYGLVGLLALVGLILQGFGYLLILALPGVPVFAWHLYLVSRRSERRQLGVEIVATGILALAAPAAYWVAVGAPSLVGWWLLLLCWFQSAASIVYAYLRLEQRALTALPDMATRIRMGSRALAYTSFNLLAVAGLGFAGILPPLLFVPYAVQWAESTRGVLRPAIGLRPTSIGVRQLIVSTLFTILFILAWRI